MDKNIYCNSSEKRSMKEKVKKIIPKGKIHPYINESMLFSTAQTKQNKKWKTCHLFLIFIWFFLCLVKMYILYYIMSSLLLLNLHCKPCKGHRAKSVCDYGYAKKACKFENLKGDKESNRHSLTDTEIHWGFLPGLSDTRGCTAHGSY